MFVLAKYQLELGVPEQGGISANPRSTSRAFGKYAHLCHTRMSVLIALMPGFSSKIGTTHQRWDRLVFLCVLIHCRKSFNLDMGYRGKGMKELLKQGPKKKKRKDSLSSPRSIRNPFVSSKRYILVISKLQLLFSSLCSRGSSSAGIADFLQSSI